MMGSDLLQIILLANVFILGVVVALAIRHALDRGKPHHDSTISDDIKQELTEAARKEFLHALESSGAALTNDMRTTGKQLNRLLENFGNDILQQEMQLFRTNLETIRKKTSLEAGNSHSQIATHQNELEMDLAKRRGELEQRLVEHQAKIERAVTDLQTSIEQSLHDRQQAFAQRLGERETMLDAALEQQIAHEREQRIKQIDTKLGDAMGSFLLEHLGSNVDLGAQTPYLLQLLEQHKDDFKREVGDDTTATTR